MGDMGEGPSSEQHPGCNVWPQLDDFDIEEREDKDLCVGPAVKNTIQNLLKVDKNRYPIRYSKCLVIELIIIHVNCYTGKCS